MKLIGRLFGWFTLLSLLFWSGVAAYMLMVQPIVKPPSDLPQSYQVCVGSYAMASPFTEVQDAVKARCADYFAALGDRDVPFYKRLYARLIGRIVNDMITTYLAQHPPQPGQSVTGPMMLQTLGSAAILEFAYKAVTEADRIPAASQTYILGCFVRKARAIRTQPDLVDLPTACPYVR